MAYVTFYRGDPAHTPKTTRPAHLGANVILTCGGKLLLEKRRDCDLWGLVGGGVKRRETELHAIAREIYEELGLRIPEGRFRKLGVYGEPGRVAAYQDGSVWRMVVVLYALELEREPELRISAESKELRFFSREEIAALPIVISHADMVEDWFLGARKPEEKS